MKCTKESCKLEAYGNSDKCVMHIEKSDNYHKDRNSRILNDFYNELFNYIFDYEKIKNYINEKINEEYDFDEIQSVYHNTKNENFFELLNKEQKLKEIIKNYFEIQKKEELDKYFGKLANNQDSIDNLDHSKLDGYNLQSYLDSFFEEEVIIFDEIFFPAYDTRDIFNYTKILKKLKKIHFNYCKFRIKYLTLNDIKVFFQDCEFFDNYSISNSNILENVSDVIYKMCIFHKEVSISKDDKQNNKINHTLFNDCNFKKSLIVENIEFEKGIFNNSISENYDEKYNEYLEIDRLELNNCIVNNKLVLNQKYNIKYLDFKETTFKSKVKIQFCEIGKAIFFNTKFQDLADFYQSKFKAVDFRRTDFEKISVFSECEFDCDVNFKYTKFLGKSIFRDTIIEGELDFRNTIFDDEANFLDITSEKRKQNEKGQFIGEPIDIKVANRETARIIKDFYDKSNNVIEANRFYKLEMEKREEELKILKNPLDWLVFKFHKISSNHSQNWLLALVWIILLCIISIGSNPIDSIIKIFYSTTPLDLIANSFYSIFKFDGENITFYKLIIKLFMGYLIYQFIISIRQNTRRK